MSQLTYNERSFAIDLISEINRWCSERDILIKRAGGEITLRGDKKRYFPDVLLYGDEHSGIVLQGWELKMPDVPITDLEFYENAKIKAKIMGLKSFLLWNVTEARLYRMLEDDQTQLVKVWNDETPITNRGEVQGKQGQWVAMLHQILSDLGHFFSSGEIRSSQMITSITGEGITEFVLKYTGLMAKHLKEVAISEENLSDSVTLWWQTAKSEYFNYKEPWEPLAKVVLMAWSNRLVFCHYLKKNYGEARKIDEIAGEATLEQAIEIIGTIEEMTGIGQLLHLGLGEVYLPTLCFEAIKQLNELLINARIEKIDENFLQTLLMNIVNRSVRRIYGQFSTPPSLAAFITALVVTNKKKNVMDTCCGSGTIVKEAYQWKIHSGLSEKEALSSVYASDKLAFPLNLATTSLMHHKTMNQPLHVFNEDVLDLSVGKVLTPFRGIKDSQVLPNFGYILSNLPFVQQEDLKKMNPEAIESVNELISSVLGRSIIISKRADLYAYLPFKQWELLEDGGKLAIIVSNAWLATEWGQQFFDLIREFYHMSYVIGSNKGRWFDNADVVSTIIVLEKRSIATIQEAIKAYGTAIKSEEITRFVLLEQTIDDIGRCVNKSDGYIDGHSIGTNATVNEIDFVLLNEICTNIRLGIKDERFTYADYNQKMIDDLLSMGISKNTFFGEVDWLLEVREKLIAMKDCFNIARGERRGWDPLFFPKDGHGIEEVYIRPVLKTAKEIKGYKAKAYSQAFCCMASVDELIAQGHHGALNWIGQFEHTVNGIGKPLPEVLKRKGVHWYEMKPETMAEVCISINPNDRLFFSKLEDKSFVNQRLMRFVRKDEGQSLTLLVALLNSLVGLFYIEALGFGRGLGALDLNPTNFKKKGYMLDAESLSDEEITQIESMYSILEERPVKPILDELVMEDRETLDRYILKCYGLEDYYEEIKASLLKLYGIRRSVR